MHIFIIPSWFPNDENPVQGIFTKEQALAIAELRNDWKIAISLWGQGMNFLFLRAPKKAVSKFLRDRKKRIKKEKRIFANYYEFINFCFEWSPRVLGGNIRNVVKANDRNLLSALQEFGNIDIIHAHVSFPAGFIAKTLSEKYSIPYIITEHMSPFPFNSFLKKDGNLQARIKEPLFKANSVIAVSPTSAKQIQSYRVPEPICVPNVVDETFFFPKQSTRHRKGAFSFFTLGFLSPQKGIDDLISGIERFLQRMEPNERGRIIFNIGGSGPDEQELKKTSEIKGLSGNIRWLGPLSRERARDHFQNCDCFILTSRHESFGVVYAEALACGKPVIATKCGGPEFFINDSNGVLVDVGGIDQIADALEKVYRTIDSFNPEIIREGFLKRFSREVVVGEIEKVYQSVLS